MNEKVLSLDNIAALVAEGKQLSAIIPTLIAFLEKNPNHQEIMSLLGAAFQYQGDMASALIFYKRAFHQEPMNTRLRINLAGCFHHLGYFEAERSLLASEALTLSHQGEANLLKAHLAMLEGNLKVGLKLYESRFDSQYMTGQRAMVWREKLNPKLCLTQPIPLEDYKGMKLIIYTEQGHGDIIMTSRYLKLLNSLGAKVCFLNFKPALNPLFAHQQEGFHLLQLGDNITEYDHHASLMSLPFLMSSAGLKDEIDLPPPFLFRPSLAARAKFSALRQDSTKKHIGLIAAGLQNNYWNSLRGLNLHRVVNALAPFHSKMELVNLQYNPSQENLDFLSQNPQIKDWGSLQTSFDDLAAAIDQVDIVVTIDSAGAHLAGSMGKESVLMLSHPPDWRWGLNNPKSAWYPSLHLLRQKEAGDWQSVLEALPSYIAENIKGI